MNLLVILLIAVIALVALLLLAAAILLDWKLFDFFMNLGSGQGPLGVSASDDGKRVILQVVNNGKKRMRLLAVEGRDTSGRRVFPTPMLDAGEVGAPEAAAQGTKEFAKVVLDPGAARSVILDRDELVKLNCRSLGVRAGQGRVWPASGFDGLESQDRVDHDG